MKESHPGEELLDTLTRMVGDAVFTHGKFASLKGKFTRGWMQLMDEYVARLVGMPPNYNSSDCFVFAGFVFNIVEDTAVKGVVYLEDPYEKAFTATLSKSELDSLEAFLKHHNPTPLGGDFYVDGMN